MQLSAVKHRVVRAAAAAINCLCRRVWLRARVIAVRSPEPRQLPSEVQFEVAPNAVTRTGDPGAARLLTGPDQSREE